MKIYMALVIGCILGEPGPVGARRSGPNAISATKAYKNFSPRL